MIRPTQERLKELLIYVPETGMFYRRARADRSKAWNTRYAGKEAGWCADGTGAGYICIVVDGVKYYAHVLAWVYMKGEWPPVGIELDHRNRKRRDNRWGNLRLATKGQNSQNHGISRKNTSGHKGVSWDTERSKWFASITADGLQRALGRFDRIEDAIAARRAAEREHHGAFASVTSFTSPGFPSTWRCHVVRECTAAMQGAA